MWQKDLETDFQDKQRERKQKKPPKKKDSKKPTLYLTFFNHPGSAKSFHENRVENNGDGKEHT